MSAEWLDGKEARAAGAEARKEDDRRLTEVGAAGWADPHLWPSHMHPETGTVPFTQQNQQAFVDRIMK